MDRRGLGLHPSTLSTEDVDAFCRDFHIPGFLQPLVPGPDKFACGHPDRVMIYNHVFKSFNVRYPIYNHIPLFCQFYLFRINEMNLLKILKKASRGMEFVVVESTIPMPPPPRVELLPSPLESPLEDILEMVDPSTPGP
ncbi:hypothetical protein R6Q59_028128 [Mikania micrantha]